MKKNFILTLAALAFFSVGSSNIATISADMSFRTNKLAAQAEETFEWPAKGTIDETSPMRSQWQGGNFGFKRIGDFATAVTGTAGFGQRCDYGQKKFTKDDFEIQLNLKDFPRGDVLGFMCTGALGAYVSEETCQLNMDILKSPAVDDRAHAYMITLNRGASKGEEHNVSIEGWTNNTEPAWLDAYSGVIVTPEDDIITIKFKSVSDTRVKICVNEVEIEFDKSLVFETLAEEFYLGFGSGFNGGDTHFVVNYAMDAKDKAYYDEINGAYFKTKKAVNDFVKDSSESKLDTMSEFVNLFNRSLTISLDGLYSYDAAYLKKAFNPAIESLKTRAIEKYGNNAFIELFKSYADKLHSNIDKLGNEDALKEAMKASQEAQNMIAAIDSLTLTDEEKATYDAAKKQYNDDVAAMNKKAKELYVALVNKVVDALNGATTTEQVAEANNLYATMPATYRPFVDTVSLEELDAKLKTAREAFVQKFQVVSNDEYVVAGTSYLINQGEKLGLVTADQGIVFKKEQFDLADFSFTYDMKSKDNYCIALMDNAEFMSAADDASVADHKGLIFLVRPKNETTAYVETYMIDGTCSRFFDGQLSQTSFDIPLTGEIKLSLKIETKETSGVFDNYFVFDFNGHTYEQPIVKAQSLLGAFEDKMGYLSIGGMSSSSSVICDIKDINGITMDKGSHKKTIDYSPKSSVSSIDFKKGTTANKILPINPMLNAVKAVTMDGAKLGTTEYSYTRNSTLTLKAAYLNTLSVGAHTLKVETDGGLLEVVVNVTEDKKDPTPSPTTESPKDTSTTTTPEEKPTKKGCGGSVIAASSIVGTLALISTAFVLKKKKEDR